jgi:hypothetical protein
VGAKGGGSERLYREQIGQSGEDKALAEEIDIVEHLFKRPHNMFLNVGCEWALWDCCFFSILCSLAGKMCWKTMRRGKDRFPERLGVLRDGAFAMFLVKGSLDPIFTHLTEAALVYHLRHDHHCLESEPGRNRTTGE